MSVTSGTERKRGFAGILPCRSDPSALNIQNCSMNSGNCSDDITDDAFLKESDKTWKFLLFASLISFIIKEE